MVLKISQQVGLSEDQLPEISFDEAKQNIPQWAVKSFNSLGEFGVGDARHHGKHDGIDLGTTRGTSVYSTLPGIVKTVYKEARPWVEGELQIIIKIN